MTYVDNTMVSNPGAGAGGASSAVVAPNGAGLPAANISMTSAVLIPLGVGVGGLAVLYSLFRRQAESLPPLRVDAAQAINVYLSWLVIQTPIKLLAYKYHAHKVAQAVLLVS